MREEKILDGNAFRIGDLPTLVLVHSYGNCESTDINVSSCIIHFQYQILQKSTIISHLTAYHYLVVKILLIFSDISCTREMEKYIISLTTA